MPLGGICELVLETDDVESLERFYRELGLELLLEEGDGVGALAEGSRGP